MMGTIRNSSSKLFSDKYRYRETGFLCTRHALCRPQIRSLQLLPFDHVNVNFSLSISLLHKSTQTIYPVSSLSSPDKQTDIENKVPEIEDIDQSKTVRVKFQLERECSFGQQFLIVGDDPMLGLWDPLNALPLNWSDGHVWTAELDVPIGKSIKFKFLLKVDSEDILWQPGPDRILQTWETEKTITVCENWDNADLQKLAEEEPSSNQIETSITNGEMVIAADLTQQILTNDVEQQEDSVSISNKDMNILGDNGRAMNVKDLGSKNDEGGMGSYEGVPVLVPGLTPLPIPLSDEESPNEVEKNFSSYASEGAAKCKPLDVAEMPVVDMDLKEVPEDDSPHPKETTDTMFGDEQEPHKDEQGEKLQLAEEQDKTNAMPFDDGVLGNDIQWGRKTIQKFLSNLGIL